LPRLLEQCFIHRRSAHSSYMLNNAFNSHQAACFGGTIEVFRSADAIR
jgi:hypothetical protein